MAQILNSKGKALIVDLTPMVDLGFLLITFFMLTTTMSKPTALQLPYKGKEVLRPNVIPEDAALTIIIGEGDTYYTYEGNPAELISLSNFDSLQSTGILSVRAKIVNAKRKVNELKAKGVLDASDELTIVIKPNNKSNTNQLINVLDEMTIGQIRLYAVDDLTAFEHTLFQII